MGRRFTGSNEEAAASAEVQRQAAEIAHAVLKDPSTLDDHIPPPPTGSELRKMKRGSREVEELRSRYRPARFALAAIFLRDMAAHFPENFAEDVLSQVKDYRVRKPSASPILIHALAVRDVGALLLETYAQTVTGIPATDDEKDRFQGMVPLWTRLDDLAAFECARGSGTATNAYELLKTGIDDVSVGVTALDEWVGRKARELGVVAQVDLPASSVENRRFIHRIAAMPLERSRYAQAWFSQHHLLGVADVEEMDRLLLGDEHIGATVVDGKLVLQFSTAAAEVVPAAEKLVNAQLEKIRYRDAIMGTRQRGAAEFHRGMKVKEVPAEFGTNKCPAIGNLIDLIHGVSIRVAPNTVWGGLGPEHKFPQRAPGDMAIPRTGPAAALESAGLL